MLNQSARYFVPEPSHWPIIGSVALLSMASGAALWMNEASWGKFPLIVGLCLLFLMMFGWFGSVARESEGGQYNKQIDAGFRWGMSWFIFSEVMFFAAFFGALFYMRVLSIPWLGDVEHKLLWPEFAAQWPSAGPGASEKFTPMAAWGIPAINTALLLSSGVTVTWAHWGLLQNSRRQLSLGLAATVLLGIAFLVLQAYEYHHAYTEMGLTLGAGAYGATFFMLTGFHGFHVTLGAIMLSVILARSMQGHFTADRHLSLIHI